MTALFVSLFCCCRVAKTWAKLFQKINGRFGDDCARCEDRRGTGLLERVIVLRRDDAANNNHDFRRALIGQSLFELRHEGEVTCCQ